MSIGNTERQVIRDVEDHPPERIPDGIDHRKAACVIHLADGILPTGDSTALSPQMSYLLITATPIDWTPP